jgi:hypothetical protein
MKIVFIFQENAFNATTNPEPVVNSFKIICMLF